MRSRAAHSGRLPGCPAAKTGLIRRRGGPLRSEPTCSLVGVRRVEGCAMDFIPRLVVLRLVNGVVLDHPFDAGARFPLWAATLDADAADPSGWRRSLWPPAP